MTVILNINMSEHWFRPKYRNRNKICMGDECNKTAGWLTGVSFVKEYKKETLKRVSLNQGYQDSNLENDGVRVRYFYA